MACLESAGIPAVFVAFVQHTLARATIRIVMGDRLSVPLPVTSGVRQGDPLSPILFNLALEPLLVTLAQAGIDAQENADDTAIAFQRTKRCGSSARLRGRQV